MSGANIGVTNITVNIEEGWSFTQLSGHERNQSSNRGTNLGEWLPTKVPTGVHEELLKHSRIPDPFVGINEHLIQWIGEETWAFQTKLRVTAEMHAFPHIDLVFDGLDTYATVQLDGKIVLESNNMFVPHRVPIKDALGFSDAATEHSLLITFHSSFLKGRSLQRENADKTPVAIRGGGSTGGAGVMQNASNKIPGPNGELALWNGDASRLHVRKAQYHYGWDWGPVLMCIGPWKPIRLESYQLRIADIRTEVEIPETLDVARVKVYADLSGICSETLTATLTLKGPTSATGITSTVDIASGANKVEIEVQVQNPQLWYPVGQGLQSLYTACLNITDAKTDLANAEKRIGLRRVQVVRRSLKDQVGESFFFSVNGRSIFAGGSNWIPADSFLTTISPDRYRAWLQLLVDGNQNMIRVWGGGIYEADVFYDTCDELGIMVWQDFMFGCGQYPAYDEFLERVSAEVEANIKRLRHHPSIVIWAGNNEDYALAESIPLELDYSVEWPSVDFRKTSFPARYIYEVLLPEAIKKYSPDTYYHRGSPYSGSGKRSDDKQYGDIHQWNASRFQRNLEMYLTSSVGLAFLSGRPPSIRMASPDNDLTAAVCLQGSQEPWHNWDILAGRFVSEFGMQGYPDIRTVDYWIGNDKSERYPQSRTMNSHNKADGFERRLELYLMENFKHAFDIESYVYYTQVMQAECLAAAYRLWRREWRGPNQEYVGGAIVWQINDCWPVTSWSICDYFLRPKPAYFTIARELAPFTVGMTRKSVKTITSPDSVAYFTISSVLEVWATNSHAESKKVKFEVHAFDVEAGAVVDVTAEGIAGGKEVALAPNSTTELWKGQTPGIDDVHVDGLRSKPIVIQARLVDVDTGVVLARYCNWPEPFKYIHFPTKEQVNLKIVPTVASDGPLGSTSLTITVDRPIKGLILDVEGPWAKFSDQAIDMFPGDTQVVGVIGLEGREVKARYLGDGSA